MKFATKDVPELAAHLKAAADAHPVIVCCEPPHQRHQAEFEDGTRICFTRNIRGELQKHVLSIRGVSAMPTDAFVRPLLDAVFGAGLSVVELSDIRTPNVRCFSQDIKVS